MTALEWLRWICGMLWMASGALRMLRKDRDMGTGVAYIGIGSLFLTVATL